MNVADTLQGIGAVDTAKKKATVLLGGGSKDVALGVSGISSATFGTTVNVQVRQDRLNGTEGASLQPPVILSTQATVTNGTISITIPNRDRYSDYQVEITPTSAAAQPVAITPAWQEEAANGRPTGSFGEESTTPESSTDPGDRTAWPDRSRNMPKPAPAE